MLKYSVAQRAEGFLASDSSSFKNSSTVIRGGTLVIMLAAHCRDYAHCLGFAKDKLPFYTLGLSVAHGRTATMAKEPSQNLRLDYNVWPGCYRNAGLLFDVSSFLAAA